MNILPSFILKKIYQKGSLKATGEGVSFKLKNILGPGIITGINYIQINDRIYNSSMIKIIKSGASTLAEQVSCDDPLIFKLNEDITCVIKNCLELQEGLNKIIVELISKDVGKVNVTLSEVL
jgi:hydroxymethylglutaryl-CoA reductase (NADPH)